MKDIPWEALVGLAALLVTSLPQLTSRARLRRRMSFWAEQVQSTDIGYDRDVAEGFRRQASAKLIALEAYPAYTFLVPLYSAFLGFLSAFSLGVTQGDVYPKSIGVDPLSEAGVNPFTFYVFVVPGAFFIFASILGMAITVDFRKQIATKYLTAQVLERGDKRDRGTHDESRVDHTRDRFKVSRTRYVLVATFSLAIFILVANIFFMLRVGAGPLVEMTPLGGSLLLWSTTISFLLILSLGSVVRRLFTMNDAEWKHPIPLSEGAAATRMGSGETQAASPSEANGATDTPHKSWWRRLLSNEAG